MKSFIADKQRKLSKLALYNIEDLSFSAFMKALRHRDIKVNGKRVSSDVILSVGDKVEIYFVENKAEKYNEIFKDDNIIVVDKKKGYSSESVFESLKNQIGEVYFIHRLDRNTSGIMIFALNHLAEKALLSGFKNRTFEKYYKTYKVSKNGKEFIFINSNMGAGNIAEIICTLADTVCKNIYFIGSAGSIDLNLKFLNKFLNADNGVKFSAIILGRTKPTNA